MLDAAEQLIRERGFESVTIADVVARAQSSVGSFYARFADKDALVRAVQDRVLSRIEQILQEHAPTAWAGTSLADTVPKLVASLDAAVEEAPLFHAFLAQSTTDAVMRTRGRRFGRKLCELWGVALLAHRSEIGHTDPELAIEFAYAISIALLERRLLFGKSSGSETLGRPELVRELTRNVLAYLRSAAPKAAVPARAANGKRGVVARGKRVR